MEVLEPQTAQPTDQPKRPVGRPKGSKNRSRHIAVKKQIVRQLRAGQTPTIDKAWLLAELMDMYSEGELKGRDKLTCLEMIAKLQGYSGKNIEEPEDERKAIADLIEDMSGRQG